MMEWAGPMWGSLRPVELEQTEGNAVSAVEDEEK